jgi:hypothetical protein
MRKEMNFEGFQIYNWSLMLYMPLKCNTIIVHHHMSIFSPVLHFVSYFFQFFMTGMPTPEPRPLSVNLIQSLSIALFLCVFVVIL